MAVKEKVINITILKGETEASYSTALEVGFVLGAELHTNHTDIDNFAQYGIYDDSGVSFSKPTHIDHWKRREGAGFDDSYKPLFFNTESKTFGFKAKTNQPVIKDTYFHLILIYKINPESCT